MRPLLKESFMFKVSKNAKISFFVKSKNLAVVRVTNEMSVPCPMCKYSDITAAALIYNQFFTMKQAEE